jgi:hypothetical protein
MTPSKHIPPAPVLFAIPLWIVMLLYGAWKLADLTGKVMP